GNYTFTNLGPDTYRVRQVVPAHWLQSTANPADITTSSGSNVAGVNFGNLSQTITLRGQVFLDTDGNGVHDTGEAGPAGRTVFLDTHGNGALDAGETSTVTDGSGRYSFSDLGAGTYRVRQVLPAGWLQTTADPADVNASSSGIIASGDFGTFEQITLSGQVFQDSNGDGSQQTAEVGLEGRAVQLLD